jgi:hypothetical protein
MSDALQRAAAFFAGREWSHRTIDRPHAVEVSHDWAGIPFKSYAQSKEEGRVFLYYSLCPEKAPAERRADVMMYLTRINFRLLVGAFELDWDDGEVRFRASVDLGGGPLTDELIGGVVYPSHQAMIDYLPNLLAVLHGEQDPHEAFREATDPSIAG